MAFKTDCLVPVLMMLLNSLACPLDFQKEVSSHLWHNFLYFSNWMSKQKWEPLKYLPAWCLIYEHGVLLCKKSSHTFFCLFCVRFIFGRNYFCICLELCKNRRRAAAQWQNRFQVQSPKSPTQCAWVNGDVKYFILRLWMAIVSWSSQYRSRWTRELSLFHKFICVPHPVAQLPEHKFIDST